LENTIKERGGKALIPSEVAMVEIMARKRKSREVDKTKE
jgi:hypothetical protein